MPNTFCWLAAVSLLAALGCGSGPPIQDVCGTVSPGQDQAAPVAGRDVRAEPPERSCADLVRAAHEVVGQRNACTQDADCAMTAGVCVDEMACGVGVRAGDADEVDRDLAELSREFEVQCDRCASERVRCMKPNPVCRDGRCKHEAPQASCEQLDRDAEALLAQHNACASDDDCVFVRDDGGCPDAFACAVVVNKSHAAAFAPLATELSRTYFAHCGRCARHVAECQVMAPACTRGRCSVRWDP